MEGGHGRERGDVGGGAKERGGVFLALGMATLLAAMM